MAKTDNLLFGTYVGLVVDVNDPDQLGRAKILVPGKNGPLFQGWNNLNNNITFSSVTPDAFPEDVLNRLRKTLPWARPSAPIWGGGTGSFNNTSSYNPFAVPTDAAFSGGSISLDGSNGRLDPNNPNQLVSLNGFSGHYAHPIVAGKFYELVAAAKRDGINLGLTDSYRTFDQQVILKQKKPGLAATPGRSNHGWGLAFDFRGTNGTSTAQAYEWLRNNASNYGWANYVGGFGPDNRGSGGGQKEPWHWQINKSDLGKYANYSVNGSANLAFQGNPSDNRITFSDGVNNAEGKFDDKYPIGSGGIPEDSRCGVNKTDLYKGVLNYIKDKPTYNTGTPPANGAAYGINGTPESWARFYAELAGHESGYSACKPFKNDINGVPEPGGSGGLFQLGRDQIEIWMGKYPDLARQYGLEPGRNYTEQELYNADLNTRGMLFIGDALLRENYAVGPTDPKTGKGLGRTIGSLSWSKIARGEPTGNGSSDPNRLVQRTTNQGVNAFGDVNIGRAGGPVGTFSTPAVGAKVWVIFESGSPQRPVYFGQVYDPSNIQSYS